MSGLKGGEIQSGTGVRDGRPGLTSQVGVAASSSDCLIEGIVIAVFRASGIVSKIAPSSSCLRVVVVAVVEMLR